MVSDCQIHGGSNVLKREHPVIATTPVKPSLRAANAELDSFGDGRRRRVEALENRTDEDDAVAERAKRPALYLAAVCVETNTLDGEDVRSVGEESPLDDVDLFEMRTSVHRRIGVAQRGDECGRADKLLAVFERASRMISQRQREHIVYDAWQPALARQIGIGERSARIDYSANNGRRDLFVRNLETGVTTLVSVNFAGTGTGTGDFGSAVVSSDGCFVAFTSSASDLVGPGIDTNNLTDVFVRDLQAGVTMLVSVNERGTASGNEHSLAPTISADGHRIAFLSGASNLVADGMDDNAAEDVFVRDIESGVTTLVSVNSAGTGSAETHSTMPVISADGRVVAFKSFADDLAAPGIDSNLTGDVFVRDLAAGTTMAISVNPSGTATGKGNSAAGDLPVLSADGRFVAFVSSARDVVTPETDDLYNVFLRDRQLGRTILVTADPTGAAAGEVGSPSFNKLAISSDGRFVAFESSVTTLVRGITDQNDDDDVFLRDTRSGITSLASTNQDRTATGNGSSFAPVLSASGKVLAFASSARDLVDPSVTNFTNVYRFSR